MVGGYLAAKYGIKSDYHTAGYPGYLGAPAQRVGGSARGDVTAVENLGKKDFVRVTDKKLTGATYVHVNFTAPSNGPSQLKERLRLNHSVYRTFVQSV